MTVLVDMAQRFALLSESEEDPNARAVYALAAATAAGAEALATELRHLGERSRLVDAALTVGEKLGQRGAA